MQPPVWKAAASAFACVVQDEPLGTAHAVAAARPLLQDFDGDVLVLYADTPLVRGETLERLIQSAARAALVRPRRSWVFARRIRRSTAGSSLAPDGTLSPASSSTPRPAKRSARSRSATPA